MQFKPHIKYHLIWIAVAFFGSIELTSVSRYFQLYYALVLQCHFLTYIMYVDLLFVSLKTISMHIDVHLKDCKTKGKDKSLTEDIKKIYILALDYKKLVNNAFGLSITLILIYVIIVFVVYCHFSFVTVMEVSNIMDSLQGLFLSTGKISFP